MLLLDRKNRIIAFFSSFLDNAFIASYPHQLLLENGTDEEYKNAGYQLSNELIQYIKKINPGFFEKFNQ